MKTTNVALFVSDSGCNTNLGHLIPFGVLTAIRINSAKFSVLLTNKPFPFYVRMIISPFLAIEVVNHTEFNTRKDFESELIRRLEKYDIGLVVLAGFMRILSPFFLDHFKNKVINIHPGLLPSFPGINATQQALDYGVKIAGCTAHFVDEGVDTASKNIQGGN